MDISDDSLKFAELIFSKDGIKLGRYGERRIPFGIIESRKIKRTKEFEKILSALKKEKRIKSACISFEPEGQAIIRAILKKSDLGTYMIVDIGRKSTGIYIVSRQMVMFSSVFSVGGDMFTNIIMKSLKISPGEAEKIKQKHGIDRNYFDKKVFLLLLDGLSILRDEISRRFLYWHTHRNEKNKNRPQIEKIILCGDGSNLMGFSEYLSASMKIKVELANVWTNILDIKKHIPEMSFEESLSFATALGLALKNFDKSR